MEARKDSSELGQDVHALTTFKLNPKPDDAPPFGYLLDLAKHPETLRLLFECEAVPAYDLPYLHSDQRESAFHGPLLIEPVGDECRDWLNDWLEQGKALAVSGKHLTLQIVGQHLVSLNTVQTPYGQSLLRYADPASFGSLGPSLSDAQRLRILGPCCAIQGRYMDRNWRISGKQPEDVVSPEDNPEPLKLTQENLTAIAAYRRELLSSALAESNNLEHDLVAAWFRQLEALGAPSEQGLVEGGELLIQSGLARPLNDREAKQIRQSGNHWSDKLEGIARIEPQEGT